MHGLGEKESVIGHLAVSSGSSIEVLHSSSSAQLHRCTVSILQEISKEFSLNCDLLSDD